MTQANEPVPTPLWFKVLLVLEALNWVGHVVFVVLVLLIAPGMSSPHAGVFLGSYLTMAAVGLGVVVFIIVSLVKGSARPVTQRFGMLHNLQGFIYNLPICVALAVGMTQWENGFDWEDALIGSMYITIVLGIPVIGFLLSRREHKGAVWTGIVIGVLCYLGGGVAFFLAVLGFAGFTA